MVLSQDGKTPFDNNLSVTAFPGMLDCSLVFCPNVCNHTNCWSNCNIMP